MRRKNQVVQDMILCLFLLFGLSAAQVPDVEYTDVSVGSKCYDEIGNPQRCIPEFVNAAFDVLVEVTNTCGEYGPTEYCSQTGARGPAKTCEICDSRVPELAHPARYLTDFNSNDNQTHWQSETMLEGVQYPNMVNLTMRLKKAFDITYVRVKFQSPRPESFAIYKRTSEDGPLVPYQYYSATCRDTYGIPDRSYVSRDDETKALCTSEFSDISPLTGGSVAFSTLEGRPSAYDFENSKALQEWVTATDIVIVLNRLNTFGDEVFGDPKVLKSYFYAISDIAVGGRCKCNGHASECVPSTSVDGESRLVCRCEHNTDGPDCNMCKPFYNDRPWKRASSLDAFECKECNCNNFTNRCFFDQALYEKTGHGGHCIDCKGNRDGPNCERCKENHYMLADGFCTDCQCNEIGSESLQCNRDGRCSCKPGVTGEKCDRCADNFYDFGVQGCKPCGCSVAGSYENAPRCDSGNGVCVCKENVEGQRCDICKPGFFNLDEANEFGCSPCFCFGHSSVCRSAPGYARSLVESVFARNDEKWSAVDRGGNKVSVSYNPVIQNIGASSTGDMIYFLAPERYLGDQRASYNQDLSFALRVGEASSRATIEDIVLEGSGLTISQAIFGQGNPLPTIQNQIYKFKLHEHPRYGWTPRLTSRDFISILANLTAIKIRATYTPRGVGFLDDVKVTSARRGGHGPPATWIERCQCPEGYVGQFCESCAPGYRHDPPMGGPFARCVPCNCNGHAEVCDAETGRCICKHNTAGDNCERCARGFYGNALRGTPDDCTPCPCPNNGACIELADATVVCLECPVGYAGPRCELCSDGYFGDPEGRVGPPRPCQPCDCSSNVDPNAVGNCNRTTGECLKCIYNTGGFRCDRCLPGFFGDALSPSKGDCRACSCFRKGTVLTSPTGPPVCDQNTGVCRCKPNVVGKNCDMCEEGFFNIDSNEGCEACDCDPVGSLDRTCDISTGQCKCRPGVIGRKCDQCEVNYYGFSTSGCKPCECDAIGSTSLQCSPTGQCPCRENVEGRRCDRCKENKQDRERGCVDCPPCYNLVQDAANDHRAKLSELKDVLDRIVKSPTLISDADFDRKLTEVQERVERLFTEARLQSGGDQSVAVRLDELRRRLAEVQNAAADIRNQMSLARENAHTGAGNVKSAESAIERAREALKASQRYLELEGAEALQRAIQRSERFSQKSDKMSENAREARLLAENLEQVAASVENAAKEAVNVSSNAYNLSRDAIERQRNTTEEIRRLQSDVRRTRESVESSHQLAERALEAARNAHNDALGLLGEAYALSIPNLDWQSIKNEAMATADDAKRIQKEVEELMDSNQQLMRDALQQAKEGVDLVERGRATQQQIDVLLAEIDAALAKSDEAVALGDKTLQEAQKTLETLNGFDTLVRESKDKAGDALGLVPEIEQLVSQAEQKTREAESALSGAARDAGLAKDLAQEAENVAQLASKEAQTIRQTAASTKDRAGNLRDAAQELGQKVAVTTGRLQTLEGEASEDQTLVKEALEKANRAKEVATESSAKVREALASVTDILSTLGNAGSVDLGNLAELERKLADAERSFQEAGVEKRTEELRQSRIQQVQWIRDYDLELGKLRSEVDNIQAIKEALPDNCWKRLKLEP